MTKVLLEFPRTGHTRLVCNWIQTGNPRQPFDCIWVDEGAESKFIPSSASKGVPFDAAPPPRFGSRQLCCA